MLRVLKRGSNSDDDGGEATDDEERQTEDHSGPDWPDQCPEGRWHSRMFDTQVFLKTAPVCFPADTKVHNMVSTTALPKPSGFST
jgi:hypothetical protein